MAAKSKPYEQFGPFLLFKKLESDSLGELWRAGRIEGSQLGATVALRRLTGGNRAALVAAATGARVIAPLLTGTSFAKGQIIDVFDGVPLIAHEYAGGRSLRHIVDRARGGNGVTPNPIPIDQAIVIAEKVALSLATTGDMRFQGNRLTHGALIPQFIWISDDGEIRVAGQQLGKGVVASINADANVAAELGRYMSPEYRSSGEASKASEVYSMGAILFLLVTGVEPPDATTASAFANAVIGAKTFAGDRMPDDIRAILEKSLVLDPATRFPSMTEMKQAVSSLASSGRYSATTFNLAFYLSSLLKKELESEAIDREKEQKVNVAAYLEAPAPVAPVAAAAVPAAAVSTPDFGVAAEPKRSKAPIFAAIAAVVAVAAVGGYMMMKPKTAAPVSAAPALASAVGVPVKPKLVLTPVVAATSSAPVTATTASADPAAQQKAFEDAVNQKLQEEMMKLQSDYTAKLKQQQSKNAPVPTPQPAAAQQVAQSAPSRDDHAPSAAALDEQRRQTSAPAVPAPSTQAPAVQQLAQQSQQPVTPLPAVTTQAPAPMVREGDIVEMNEVDSIPHALTPIRPVYPPMAMRQRIEATIIVSALVSETGAVMDVKVLRGDPRFGLNEAASRALRQTHFSPAMKDGKRVKVWFPQAIIFKL